MMRAPTRRRRGFRARRGSRRAALLSADAAVTIGESEESLLRGLIAWFDRAGFELFHDEDSRRNRRGLPDIVGTHAEAGRLLFVETKAEGGALRPEQRRWARALRRVAQLAPGVVEYHVLRPADAQLAARIVFRHSPDLTPVLRRVEGLGWVETWA